MVLSSDQKVSEKILGGSALILSLVAELARQDVVYQFGLQDELLWDRKELGTARGNSIDPSKLVFKLFLAQVTRHDQLKTFTVVDVSNEGVKE